MNSVGKLRHALKFTKIVLSCRLQLQLVGNSKPSCYCKQGALAGLVRELDKDEPSFTLRKTDDSKDHVCRFPQEFLYDVLEVFNTDQRVTFSSRKNIKNGEINVSLVFREPSATESSNSAV